MLLAELYVHLSAPITFPLLFGEQEMPDTSTQSPWMVSAKMKSMLWLLPCVLGSCDVWLDPLWSVSDKCYTIAAGSLWSDNGHICKSHLFTFSVEYCSLQSVLGIVFPSIPIFTGLDLSSPLPSPLALALAHADRTAPVKISLRPDLRY